MKLIHTNTNNIKKSLLYIFPIIAVATFTLVLTVIYNIYSISNSSAINPSTGTNVFTVSAGTSLGVSVTDSTTLNIQPTSGGAFNSTPLTVYVETDNEYGYTLSMTTTTPDLKRTTPLSDGTVPTIETLASGSSFTSDTFTTNRWGYTLDNTNYYAIPGSVIINSAGTSGNYEDNPNVITFAAKLDNATPSGNYLTTINFIATAKTPADLSGFDAAFIFAGANKLTHNGESYYAMQDLTYSVCSYVATPSSSNIDSYPTVTVFDSRDYEKYTIGKLADGNCWLLDNLRLGGDSPIALTPADTNIASNWTLPASGNTCFTESANCDNSGNLTHTGYTVAAVDASYSNEEATYRSDYINIKGKTGNYYNYCATTAGTICNSDQNVDNSKYDVCPSNWKIPSYDNVSTSYSYLYNVSYTQSITNFTNALRTTLVGIQSRGTRYEPGNRGDYWMSSAISDEPKARYMYVDENIINTETINYRFYGNSVRCVSRQTISDLTYMQDFASLSDTDKTDVINSMLPGQAYQLIDNRDNEVYNVAKLADGNVWLLDNLRLDPATLLHQLTPANTNMSPDIPFTLPDSISTGFGSFTEPQINTDYKNINATYTASYSEPIGKTGVYYNYCAASAGTYCVSDSTGLGNAEYDICPVGWKLPSGTDGGDFMTLINSYSPADLYNYFRLTNGFGGFVGGLVGLGEVSYFYSSSITDQIGAAAMYATNVTAVGIDSRARNEGYSIRCVLK